MTSFTAAHLQTALGARPLRFYKAIGSTNDAAREWLRTGAATGSVVIADEQAQGRGRQGRTWQTPPGTALAISVILRPPDSSLPRLAMLGALAIAEMAEATGIAGVGIKWPNDVQIAGRKVSGVLAEAEWHGDELSGAVLGMGVNVRVDFRGTDLEERATSLEAALGQPLDRVTLVALLLARLDAWYACLDSDALFDAWKRRLVTLGQQVKVGDVTGLAESVDGDGVLWVRDDKGQGHRVVAGDVG